MRHSGPFLAADGKTLFFSSSGYSGFGGDDLYVTRRLDDTWQSWSEPENLGGIINTEMDESFFVIPENGEYAYYSRQVGEEDFDIFRFGLPIFYKPPPIVTIRGHVYNSKTNKPLGAEIFYERLPEGLAEMAANSDSISGYYELKLPVGHNYGYLADKPGFYAISANIDLRDITESQVVEKDLYLVPIEIGQKPVLINIFFEFDKSNLKDESIPELNRLVELLNENPTVKIEIGGHTDSKGSDEYNLNLSDRRARAVHDYLVDHGIDINRLSTRGYGEAVPVDTNETDEGRQNNRRVEYTILEI